MFQFLKTIVALREFNQGHCLTCLNFQVQSYSFLLRQVHKSKHHYLGLLPVIKRRYFNLSKNLVCIFQGKQ